MISEARDEGTVLEGEIVVLEIAVFKIMLCFVSSIWKPKCRSNFQFDYITVFICIESNSASSVE